MTPVPAPAPGAAGGGPGREPGITGTGRGLGHDDGATLALTGLTLAATVGMSRLFVDASFLAPFLLAAVVGHGVAWAGRRLRAPLGVALPAGLGAVALTVAWVALPSTTAHGLPWAGTLSAARHELAKAWVLFDDVIAPAPVTRGFLIAGMGGVGLVGILADWAAFRMRAAFESAIPSFTVFVFTATLGTPAHRRLLVALYLAALLLFLLVHHAGIQSGSRPWFASRRRGGPRSLLRAGAVLGGLALGTGVIVGPRLPGSTRSPLLPLRAADRQAVTGRRTTVSPLVDIRGRLVEQSNIEVFSVRSNVRSYWRLTSLDTFDGRIWSSDASYRPAPARLSPDGSRVPIDLAVQDFSITSLSSIWLPAAYRPQRVEGVDDVSYNDELGSLITGKDSTNGLSYRVESAVPRPSASELESAGAGSGLAPDGTMQRFLRLPPVSAAVRRLATEVTAGAATPFARARALQDFFQQSFTYDLAARPGHDDRALEAFLFHTRRGYCEQFAGAYAVMARAVGLPTRVAVGFTPGELGPDGRYHVRGLNAHAWPEVLLGEFGWMAFEPTPGRGSPAAQAYTALPEAQAGAAQPSTATTAPAPAGVGSGTPTTEAGSGGGERPARPRPSPLRHPPVGAAVAALAAAALVGAVPLVKKVHRARRRARAATAADRVLVSWAEAAAALAAAGAGRRPFETLSEHARRAAAETALPPAAAAAMAALAGDAAAAGYGPGQPGPEVARRAAAAAAVVERSLWDSASTPQRVRRALDPRPLLAGSDGTGGGRAARAV